jgi:hypothetical protein
MLMGNTHHSSPIASTSETRDQPSTSGELHLYKNVKYYELHLGLNWQGFLKKCKAMKKSAKTQDAKVRKLDSSLKAFIFFLHSFLKMKQCSAVLDPIPKLINEGSLDFSKPKLFFKPIGQYPVTSHIFHVIIPFNFNHKYC